MLQFIFEQRVVSFKQLAKKFFPNAIYHAALKRLKKLALAKFIKKDVILWKSKRTVIYSITVNGIKSFCENYRYEVANFNCNSDSIRHDLGLVDIRERLEQASMVTGYYSESMLQKCPDLSESELFKEFSLANSDAALSIETPRSQFNVAVEYEISPKEEFRYVEKLRQYYKSPNVGLVLYICGNDKIENLIRKSDLVHSKKYPTKVCTCLEENLLKSDKVMSFTNYKNEIFKIV
jgi:hypothetical protein